LPITVKATLETEGIRTTAGFSLSPARAQTKRRSGRARGAAYTCSARATGVASDFSYNPSSASRNPWDPARTPGGSSGGSAAALAAGFTAFEIGSDIAGSIRVPAHWCGVYGHRPTHGLIPGRGHVRTAGAQSEFDMGVMARWRARATSPRYSA
jgi:amidase